MASATPDDLNANRERRRRLLTGAALTTLWLASPLARAQLYRKTAPPGSTFVRLLNGTATAGLTGRIGERATLPMPPYTPGDYMFLPPGPQPIQFAGGKDTYNLESEHYYTIAQTADGLKLFDLHGFESQLKAMVVLFNLLPDSAVSLKTADGKTPVFDGVGPYKAMQREINPLTVTLALFKGDQKIADVPPVTFERGKASSLIVGGTAAVPVVGWDEQ